MKKFIISSAIVFFSFGFAGLTSAETVLQATSLAAYLNGSECIGFGQTAAEYQRKFLTPMKTWSAQHLRKLGAKNLTYLFSGADVVTAMTLFPEAGHYTLIADQIPLPNETKDILKEQIKKECKTQAYFSRYGYFRTNDLEGKDSVRPRFMRLMVYSILSGGGLVRQIEFLQLDDKGEAQVLQSATPLHIDGLRLHVTSADQRPVIVDYVQMNLANSGIGEKNRKSLFLSKRLQDTVFIKSASHLLQSPNFSMLAASIVNNARNVVQDETGIDIAEFSKNYQIDGYGKLLHFHPLWSGSPSAVRLRKFLKANGASAPLPFTLGYEKRGGSLLLVGTRMQPKMPNRISLPSS